MKKFNFLIIFIAAFLLSGCEKKIITDVHEVHWDRDMCKRCAMVVSDRKHTAQVINPSDGRSYMFDDIGCAILWFKEDKIEWKDKAIIWVTDATTGKWIDARKAFYDTENVTPMAYGFMAHLDKKEIENGSEVVMFEEVSKRVIKIGK